VAVKILVADDSATMRKIMDITFAGQDAEVVSVPSGQEAVEKAKTFQPDVVFADASLDSFDGYEVAKAIKSDPSLQSAAVIVLASQHTPYDAEKGQAAGVDDHVLKPFDTQSVIDKVAQIQSKPRAAPSAPAAQPAAPAAQPAAPAARPAPPQPPARPAAASGPTPGSAAGPRPEAPRQPPPPPPSAGQPANPKATMGFGTPPARPSAPRPTGGPSKPSAPPASAVTPSGATPSGATPSASPSRAAAGPAASQAAPSAPPAASPAKPSAPPAAGAAASQAAAAATGDMVEKLRGMGLTSDQVDGVMQLSREVIEQVVWEVVPDLAEVIIREEIARLTSE
jgi:CheY-like chemotaxis protein